MLFPHLALRAMKAEGAVGSWKSGSSSITSHPDCLPDLQRSSSLLCWPSFQGFQDPESTPFMNEGALDPLHTHLLSGSQGSGEHVTAPTVSMGPAEGQGVGSLGSY